jgi:hypothetical protein
MTNFEWLLLPKNRELLRKIIIGDIAINNGEICSCTADCTCDVCYFSHKCYNSNKEKFLDEQYEMHYDFNKGDVVIVSFSDGQQLIGFFNGEFGEKVYVTPYLNSVGKFKENGVVPRGDGYRKNVVEITAYERN